MVVEAHSGKVLVASNASAKRPIASLTKIATGAVAVDWATAAGTEERGGGGARAAASAPVSSSPSPSSCSRTEEESPAMVKPVRL